MHRYPYRANWFDPFLLKKMLALLPQKFPEVTNHAVTNARLE